MLAHQSRLWLLFLALSTLGCAASSSNSCAGQHTCEEEDLLDDSALLQTKLQKTVQVESDDSGSASGAPCDESLSGKGADYRGCQTKTPSGKTCQAWNSQSPHKHSRTPSNYPNAGLVANMCRNPDGHSSIWCYTTSSTRWEDCKPLPPPSNAVKGADALSAAEAVLKEKTSMATDAETAAAKAEAYAKMCAAREAAKAKKLKELKEKQAAAVAALKAADDEAKKTAEQQLADRVARLLESQKKAVQDKIAAEKAWSEANAAKDKAAQEKAAAEHNKKAREQSVKTVAETHAAFAAGTINSWGKVLEHVTGLANPAPGMAAGLGPIEKFVEKLPLPDMSGVGIRVVDIPSRLSSADTGLATKLSKCAVLDGPKNLDGLIHSWGAALCADMQVGGGLAGCDMCFTAAYITVTTRGLNNALEKVIGFSPIKAFALFSNVKADMILINRDVIIHKELPRQLAQPLNQGLNIFGNIGTPTTCEVFGVTDVLCVVLRPAWPTKGITLFVQVSVNKYMMVTQLEFGANLQQIPIYGPTRFELIEMKYTMTPAVPPTDENPEGELPSSKVTGLVKIRTIVDLEPLFFTGQLSVGVRGPKTTVGIALSMKGIILVHNPIGPLRFGFYDLIGSLELGIIPNPPPAPPAITIENWMIGGGVCFGKDKSCVLAYNRTKDANLDDVIMGSLYMAMQLNGESVPKFCFAMTAAPFSFGKLFRLFDGLLQNFPHLVASFPKFLLEAELTGFKKCNRADAGDKKQFDCWVTIKANPGDEVNEFDFANLGVEPGADAGATSSSLSIGPGIEVSAGLQIFGAHAGIKLAMDHTYMNAQIVCSKLSLFDNNLVLSKSTKTGTKTLTEMDGPVMTFNAQWGARNFFKFAFDARLKLWDFLDAEAVVQFDAIQGSMQVMGFPIRQSLGKLIGNAFVVYSLLPPLKVKLGVMIELSGIQAEIDMLIEVLQAALSHIEEQAENQKAVASSLKDSITSRFDHANAALVAAQAEMDRAKATMQAAADDVGDAKYECQRFKNNCRAQTAACGFLQLGNHLSLAQAQERLDSLSPEQMALLNWIADEQAEMVNDLMLTYQNVEEDLHSDNGKEEDAMDQDMEEVEEDLNSDNGKEEDAMDQDMEEDGQGQRQLLSGREEWSWAWGHAKRAAEAAAREAARVAAAAKRETERAAAAAAAEARRVAAETARLKRAAEAEARRVAEAARREAARAAEAARLEAIRLKEAARIEAERVARAAAHAAKQACIAGLSGICDLSAGVCGGALSAAEAAVRTTSHTFDAAKLAIEGPRLAVQGLKALTNAAFALWGKITDAFNFIIRKIKHAVDQLADWKLLAIGFKAGFSVGEKLSAHVHASLKYSKTGPKSASLLRTAFFPDEFKEPAASFAETSAGSVSLREDNDEEQDASSGEKDVEAPMENPMDPAGPAAEMAGQTLGKSVGFMGEQQEEMLLQIMESTHPGFQAKWRNLVGVANASDIADVGTHSSSEEASFDQLDAEANGISSMGLELNLSGDTKEVAKAVFDGLMKGAKEILDVVTGKNNALGALKDQMGDLLNQALRQVF